MKRRQLRRAVGRRMSWMLVPVLAWLASCGRAAGGPNSGPSQPPATSTLQPVSLPTSIAVSPSRTAPAGLPHETRAVWSWVGQTARSKANVDALVAQMDAAHLNVVLLGVYKDGTAYFEPSHQRFPVASQRLTNQSMFDEPGYPDALSYLLEVRDRRRADSDPTNDFEVHAWFTVHRGGDAVSGWPPRDLTQPYMLNALFPEFRLKYGAYYTSGDARYVNPAVAVIQEPFFRHYMAELMAGLVEDYNVDGVHLDFIRTGGICFNDETLDYPGTEFDYPGCQKDYLAWTQATYGRAYSLWQDTDGQRRATEAGRERISAWQVHSVGMLVEAIHDSVKAAKPGAIISVASVENVPWELPVEGQVSWAWLDAGWVDAIFPTLYLDDTQAIVDRVERLRAAVQDESRRWLIFPGLATYAFDTKEKWSGLVAERVCAVMCAEGSSPSLPQPTRGVALFRSEHLTAEALAALAAGPFRMPAVPYWGEDSARGAR